MLGGPNHLQASLLHGQKVFYLSLYFSPPPVCVTAWALHLGELVLAVGLGIGDVRIEGRRREHRGKGRLADSGIVANRVTEMGGRSCF